jgi:hypothetical protein
MERLVSYLVLAICKKTYFAANVAMAVNNNSLPLSRRYRTRAEECRRIAETLHGAETRLKLLRIAADYDWMAMRSAAFELQQADELARSFAKSNTRQLIGSADLIRWMRHRATYKRSGRT